MPLLVIFDLLDRQIVDSDGILPRPTPAPATVLDLT